MSQEQKHEQATFAGGCFWCTEAELQQQKGVLDVISGYTGGKEENPAYKHVAAGKTGHAEAVLVTFDPEIVSYKTLLDIYWSNIDPTDKGGQFFDRGSQYRTAIFYTNDQQKALAENSKREAEERLRQALAPEILPAQAFYPAEEEHQDFFLKNPDHYARYKKGSRRQETLKRIWGDKK